ncbi:PDZ domain-containing protein [Marilutibacter aestuarii]|uniref:PDZ domain-containing protein n=1 Tax=Marilutibacter aestuarii TaxID=1706195 RepID=A0A508AER9_9GAMM|nr:PDZ domain-containing protein [Lysobacter aestuarii]TQD48296.1 PDZ domain-containing protein [Lysobacter aestuarii]
MNFRHLQRHLAVAILALSAGAATLPAFASGTPSTVSLPMVLAGAQSSALDAVIDVRRPETRGVAVLAITPGGNADRMGMRVGDRLLSVNGRSLTDTLEPNTTLQAALAQGGAISATVSRDGQVLELSDSAPVGRSAPPPSGCGYVSNRGTLPHVTDRLYPVEIISIDGSGLPIDANRHRLPAGMHAITVAERIESIRFNPVELRMREQLLRREGARAAKTLVVEVKPGTRHLLGARFLDEGLDGDRIRRNAYWEPVVWKDVADDCR